MSTIMVLLTVIGIPLGVTSIILAFRYRDRIRLTYIDEDCLPLFESIVKNIDGLEILYEKKAIDPSLYFLKGTFVNTGNLDIDKSHIYEPLSIKLPTSYKWLQAKITKSPSDINADYEIRNGSTLEFKWDLLKANEGFSFNALIKASSNLDAKGARTNETRIDKVSKIMSFSHRITNLRRITKTKGPISDFSWWPRTDEVIPWLAIGLMTGGLVGYLLFPTFFSIKSINYLLEDSNGKIFEASIQPQRNRLFRIKAQNDDFSTEIRPEDLFSEYKISRMTIEDGPRKKYDFLLGLVYSLIGGALFCLWYFRRRRQKKLHQS